jgi:hypothetical protein
MTTAKAALIWAILNAIILGTAIASALHVLGNHEMARYIWASVFLFMGFGTVIATSMPSKPVRPPTSRDVPGPLPTVEQWRAMKKGYT